MSRLRRHVGFVAVFITGLLAGCGGDDGEPRPDAASSAASGESITSESPAAEREPARVVLNRWKRQTVTAETGSWSSEHELTRYGDLTQTGSYDLDPVSVEATTVREFGLGPETVLMQRSNPTGAWLRWTGAEVNYGRCWLDLATTPEFTSGGPRTNRRPAALEALLESTHPRYAGSGSAIAVRADVGLVMRLVVPVLEGVGIPEDDRGMTTVLATMTDGEITGWEADLRRVLTDAERAGMADPGVPAAEAAGLWLTVSFDELGEPVVVQAPPRRLVRAFAEETDIEVAFAGCGRNITD